MDSTLERIYSITPEQAEQYNKYVMLGNGSHGLCFFKGSHITLIGPGFYAVFLCALLTDSFCRLPVPGINNGNIDPHGCKLICNRSTDAARSSRNDSCFSFQHAVTSAKYSLAEQAVTCASIFLIIFVSVFPGPISIKVSIPFVIMF